MPIAGLTGSVRTLRTAKLKLGYVEKGKKFPSDKDVIVGKVADGVTEEMVKAYGARLITDAKETGVYDFGRELRGMLAFEYDAMHDGHEVALELLNRSWSSSRIRCSGTGGDEDHAGEAFVRSEQYANVLRRRGLIHAERKGGWAATCLGRDCPLWYERASDDDKLPGCHREMRLHFILLHPTRDEDHPNYMQQLGWIEVASGSWNGAIDVQSGFAAIRALAGGRTALIPFRLRRVMRSVSAPNGRVLKATLLVDHWADEVLTFAMGPPGRAILRPALRRQLAELAAAEATWAALPSATYASVEDIQPQPRQRALGAPARSAPGAGPPMTDRDDAVDAARQMTAATNDGGEHGRDGDTSDEPVRLLTQPDIDALKVACGGTPGQSGTVGQPDTLVRYRELVEAAYLELGVPSGSAPNWTWIPYPGTPKGARTPGGYLTTRHRAWIEERLCEDAAPPVAPILEGQLVDPDDRVAT